MIIHSRQSITKGWNFKKPKQDSVLSENLLKKNITFFFLLY